MASRNGWESQPRVPETGQWANRQYWEPRWKEIKIRLSHRERQMIEEAAASADMTMTAWIVEACRDHLPRRLASAAPPGVSAHQARLAKRLPQNRGRR